LRTAIAVALGLAAAIACLPAYARLGVVTPVDDSGAPLSFPGSLPEGYGGFIPLSWTYVDELSPLLVHGATVVDSCDPAAEVSINATVAQSMQQMTDLDVEGAVASLDELVTNLPCLDQPASSRELARIFYYRGAALAFIGDARAAAASMRRALALDPDLPPDENLPREINDIFKAQGRRKPSDLYIGYWMPEGVAVRVDGQERPGSILGGSLGFFQYQLPSGTWKSFLLQDMQDITLVGTPLGILAHLPEVDPPVARLSTLLGAALAEPLKVDGVLFWGGEDAALLWDAQSNTTEWIDLEGDPLAIDSAPQRPARPKVNVRPPTDRVRIAFAGGVYYIHPYPYAGPCIDANFRIYRGLSIGLGVDLGFPLTGYHKTVVFPSGHLGARYTFDAGTVHPWVGLGARLAFDDRPGRVWAMVGIVGEAGLDIPLVSVLMLRIWGEGGVMLPFRQGTVHGKIGLVLRI